MSRCRKSRSHHQADHQNQSTSCEGVMLDKVMNAIRAGTEDVRGKVNLMIGRAILNVINDAGAVHTVQVKLLDGEVHDDVEVIRQYGFTGNPPPGVGGVVAFVGGNRDHGLVIAVDDRQYRMKGLKTGEVAIYDDQGQFVHISRDGIIAKGKTVIVEATEKLTMKSPVQERIWDDSLPMVDVAVSNNTREYV
jgi:phage baseplate assembly protein V